jgi:hypothetical protein
MKSLIAITALSALAALRVARLIVGSIGLQHELGVFWAVIGAASLMLFRLSLPIRIGAFLALVSLWRWPWFAALIFAAPRLLLLLPGLWSTGMARLRHPRPLWRGVPTA